MVFTWEGFKEKLEEIHIFPDNYVFKFIVPIDRKNQVIELFKGEDVFVRNSKNGKFISISVRCYVASSDEVIEIYKRASKIEGIVAL
ncbi:hypothetical protein JCM13304A_16150 [Desulfothermus okinawensis JCM 13304]